jgi:hypothetical protein
MSTYVTCNLAYRGRLYEDLGPAAYHNWGSYGGKYGHTWRH